MKAFVVTEPKKWSVKEVDVPKPKYKEVLIEMETSGICHTDLHAANYDWLVEPKYPLIPGHEGIGKVVALGEGCTRLKIGDRVALAWLHDACGYCEFCLTGRETLCPNQNMSAYTKDGSYAEYAIGHEDYVGLVPEKLDIVTGAPVVCAGVTTYKSLKQTKAKAGNFVAVIGVGGLGQMAIQYAKAMGLRPIGVDLQDEKCELALKSGAEYAFNSAKDPKFIEKIIEVTGGGVHAVVNTSVHPSAAEQGMDMLRRGGRQVLVGLPAKDKHGKDDFKVSIFWSVLLERELAGSIVGTRQDLAEALEYAAEGKVKSEVTKVVKLEEVADIFEKLQKGEFLGRAVIDFRK
ncbi:zinc-dependent alcohol dehydrogenase [Mycoplasma bovis]|uniref:Alcohol dehydrogenase n=1 Tax=Mycoplasmopsis bovis (strain ATCC 25523 / DSM 22781 / NCTC 10131 / PG45) TaxID=289397 RepID=A0A454AQE1_MYCBG|nr:alcohol dehydrogenase, zinc-dependent [Mycoplasmopsis bovis PG45]AXJ68855.1 zinc-dependent alcohol dehydrogenase [Mycoplasmopsis bovis]TKA58999.1 alcohol dehydrogenase [Mycoplasmopsis bovis 8790]TKA60531.1 alcohol dehydrogenase [Mycoplasmopsis bovis 1067]AXJ74530.1 zinc-dependent alcohol dehydrogenase [Mycoplasmopsis bovis]